MSELKLNKLINKIKNAGDTGRQAVFNKDFHKLDKIEQSILVDEFPQLWTNYSFSPKSEQIMKSENSIQNITQINMAYESIFKNKLGKDNFSIDKGCGFCFGVPLPIEVWKQVVEAFDGSNIRVGTDHWWGTATEDDKPSARAIIINGCVIYMNGIDFTEGRWGTFLAISKKGKRLYVDDNWNYSNIADVLKKNGVSFANVDAPLLFRAEKE